MMKRNLIRAYLAAAISAPALVVATPASALTINLNDIGGVTGSQAEVGFKLAAKYWESVLTNDVTMNIDVGFSALGAGILGGTRSTLFDYVPMDTYYALLGSNATKSTIDMAALASLRPLDANGGVAVKVPGYLDPATKTGVTSGYDSRLAPTDQAIGNSIAISSANVKALFNDDSFAGMTDANIQFSSTFAFDFDPTDGIAPGTYDFIGVAIHEIGHALGFLSGAEDFDYTSGSGGFPVDEYWWGYAADMFRYSGDDTLDWTYGTDSYFSLDGGLNPYLDGYWSTGSEKGDGWQASHWKEPNTACVDLRGIMNPYICSGLGDDIKALDLSLLDAIGWNVNFDVDANRGYVYSTADVYRAFIGQVPEPATWLQMIGGFALLGGAMRLRARKVAFA